MNKFLIAAFLLSTTLSASAADLPTILAENDKAHGGDAYLAVQSLRAELRIKEPTFEVEAVYVATRAGQMRIDIYAEGQRVYAEGLMPNGNGGQCGWEWNPGKPADQPAQCVGEVETAALRHGLEMPGHFHTLEDVAATGAKVELIGPAEGSEGAEWQVRLTLEDGHSRDYFISQENYRVVRAQDFRAFHPGVDDTKVTVESRQLDPVEIEGVLRYGRQENYNADTGAWMATTTVVEAVHNPEIPEGYFNPAYVPER